MKRRSGWLTRVKSAVAVGLLLLGGELPEFHVVFREDISRPARLCRTTPSKKFPAHCATFPPLKRLRSFNLPIASLRMHYKKQN